MIKFTRRSVKETGIEKVILYPNGKKSSDWKVSELKTTGIKLKGDQIPLMAASLLSMYKAGHREVNITCWLKKKSISFTGTHEYVEV